jgi:hypothetical protein
MSVRALLEKCAGLGISFRMVDGRIMACGPKPDQDLSAELSAHKEEIAKLLTTACIKGRPEGINEIPSPSSPNTVNTVKSHHDKILQFPASRDGIRPAGYSDEEWAAAVAEAKKLGYSPRIGRKAPRDEAGAHFLDILDIETRRSQP